MAEDATKVGIRPGRLVIDVLLLHYALAFRRVVYTQKELFTAFIFSREKERECVCVFVREGGLLRFFFSL